MHRKNENLNLVKKIETMPLEDKIKAVEEIFKKEKYEGVLKLLESKSWYVREKALEILLTNPDFCKKHIDDLIKGKFWYIRLMALKIINALNLQEEYFEVLEKFSKDENIELREEALKGLEKLKKGGEK